MHWFYYDFFFILFFLLSQIINKGNSRIFNVKLFYLVLIDFILFCCYLKINNCKFSKILKKFSSAFFIDSIIYFYFFHYII